MLLKPDDIQALGALVVCGVMLHTKFSSDGLMAAQMEMHVAAQVNILAEASERDKVRFQRASMHKHMSLSIN